MKRLTIDQLAIEDEASFRHVGLYADLKQVLARSGHPFQILPPGARWDRALMLSLTYWGADAGTDLLVEESLPADVVCHVAWHRLSAARFPLSADALFFGEALASAFDVYLVGRLLGHAPRSSFLETQVPAMADAAFAAGVDEAAFDALINGVAADPDRAFEDLRALLFDATTALVRCEGAEQAYEVLGRFDEHRFGCLLHHYELAAWILYARAYAGAALAPDPRVREVDALLRGHAAPLDWLTANWIEPASAASAGPAARG